MSHIDDAQWKEMVELLEDDFMELAKGYINDSLLRFEKIQLAHQSADNKMGLEAAHALKGASVSIGANNLSKHAYTMQEVCQANMVSDAHNVVNDIKNELDAVIIEIEKRLTLLTF